MRPRIARRLGVVASSLTLSLALAACGGSGGSGSSGGDTTLRVGWTATPTQLDPNVFTGLTWVYANDAYMATLLEYDTSVGADEIVGVEDLVPSLAESFEANADKTQFTFKLREGVESPYGNELDADDVIYSFERMASDPATLQAGVLLPTANVDKENPWTKVDDYTLTYNLTAPSAVSLSILAYPIMGILDSDEVEKHATESDPWASEWLGQNTAGFGPYQLDSIDPGQELRLKPNPNYFDEAPEFENIVIRSVPEGSSRAQLLVSGELDMISEPPIDQLKTIADSSTAMVSEQPDTNRHNLSFNADDEILGNAEVRRALSHAIDRQGIVDAIYQGYAQPALSPQSSSLLTDQPETGAYDPELAKQELADAGYPDGFDMELTYSTERPGPFAENEARLIQADLAEVGVNVSLKAVPSVADFEEGVTNRKYQSYLYTERPSQPDIGFGLYLYLFDGSALNKSGYSSPALDELTLQILSLPSGEERDAVVQEALAIVAEDEPIVSLVEVPDLVGLGKDIEGYKAIPSGGVMFQELSRS